MLLADVEQAESKEAIDAFAVAGDHERPFGIARAFVGRLRREFDAVSFHEIGQNVAMTALFEPVELDRLAQKRIGDLPHA